MTPEEREEYLKTDWVGPGWMPLVKELNKELSFIEPNYTIDQVKEKFGGLRYYFTCSSRNIEIMWVITKTYEKQALEICEDCGETKNVSRNTDGWIRTLCAACRGKFLSGGMGKSDQ